MNDVGVRDNFLDGIIRHSRGANLCDW